MTILNFFKDFIYRSFISKSSSFYFLLLAFSFFAIATKFLGVLTGILLFVLIMFIHEMGHFLVGLWLGFHIVEFSIFLGPRLLSFTYKGIKFSLKAIPLGASVQFLGEEGIEEDNTTKLDKENFEEVHLPLNKDGYFANRPPLYRLATVFAGPFINIFTAYLAILMLFVFTGFEVPLINKPNNDSALALAGLQGNEEIVAINGRGVKNKIDLNYALLLSKKNSITRKPNDFSAKDEFSFTLSYLDQDKNFKEKDILVKKVKRHLLGISFDPSLVSFNKANFTGKGILITGLSSHRDEENLLKKGDILFKLNDVSVENIDLSSWIKNLDVSKPVELTISRNNEILTFSLFLEEQEVSSDLGLSLKKEYGVLKALVASFNYSKSVIYMTIDSLAKLVSGHLNVRESVSGPVGIVSVISQVSVAQLPLSVRILQLVMIFALLSFSLGILNLLPIAPLDGFLIVASFYELITGRIFPKKLQFFLTVLGIILLLSIFALGLYFDLSKIFS